MRSQILLFLAPLLAAGAPIIKTGQPVDINKDTALRGFTSPFPPGSPLANLKEVDDSELAKRQTGGIWTSTFTGIASSYVAKAFNDHDDDGDDGKKKAAEEKPDLSTEGEKEGDGEEGHREYIVVVPDPEDRFKDGGLAKRQGTWTATFTTIGSNLLANAFDDDDDDDDEKK